MTAETASYATVENGTIKVMDGGRFVPVSPSLAWSDWLRCATSQSPILKGHARELRSALDEVGYLQ